MKNNFKGFTLIELLVTMVILGIVAAMAFPLVRKISENNTERKYKTYANSLESSAKLYVDSYGDDLFGHKRSGEACISYKELNKKLLTKDIADNNISCNTDETKVKIIKVDDVYSYTVQIGCGTKKENNIVPSYKEVYPKNGDISSCSNNTYTYGITTSPNSSTGSKKNYSITINLTSSTGIKKDNYEIYYKWTKTGLNNKEWTRLVFNKIESKNKQQETIATGQSISYSTTISTPSSTGSWTLIIKIETLQNIAGDSLISGENEKKFFPFEVDNTAPTISSMIVKSNKADYSSKDANITINATDNKTYTQDDTKLQVCLSESSTACSDYKPYTTNTFSYKFSGKYDGLNRTIYAYVKDEAGNVSTSSNSSYKVYSECSATTGTWQNVGTCSKSCGTGKIKQTMDKKDKYTGVSCGTAEREVDCNTQLCAPNTPTISNPTKGDWTNSNFKLNVSTTTVASNIGYWYYSYDNKNWTKYTDSKGKNSYETPDISDERNGTIYIKVCNKESNEDNPEASKCSQSSTPVKIDKTAPTCTSSGGNTSWVNTNITLNGTCSDKGSGCKGNVTKIFSTDTNTTAGSPGTVSDNAGNKTTCPANQTVKIDKTAPTCTSSGGNTSWVNTNITLTGTCSDKGSGCKGNTTKTFTTDTNSTAASPGTVSDNAGNKTTCPANQTVKIDKTAPTCTSSGGNTKWVNTNITLTGTCSDKGSGCKGNVTKIFSTDTNTTAGSPGTVSDNAGNTTSCPANQTVKIDKTAPTCTSSGGNTKWVNTNITLTGTCSDKGSGCKGNVTKIFSTDTNTTAGSPGTVSDNAGNTTSCPANQTVKIDKTAPTCTSSGGNTSWVNTNITLTGTCSDKGSGCKGNVTKIFSTDTNTTAGSPGTVSDNAGNKTTCPANQTVKIDKTAPKSPYFTTFKNSGNSNWTQSGYRYHGNLTYDETINVNIYIGSSGTFFFDDVTSSTDNTGGSGIKEERVLWTFTGTNTDPAYQCNWTLTNECKYQMSKYTTGRYAGKPNYLHYCLKAKDNAGNVSPISCEDFHISGLLIKKSSATFYE